MQKQEKTTLAFDDIAKYHNFLFTFYYNRVYRKTFKLLKKQGVSRNDIRVLDIGCATGSFFCRFKKKIKQLDYFGLDESPAMIKIAQKKFPQAKFSVGLAEKLPFPDRFFDLVVIIDALHYVQDKKSAFSEIARVLRPGGVLFIYTPSIDQFFSKVALLFGKLLSPTEKNIKPLKLSEIEKLAQTNGVKLTSRQLINWFPFFFIKNWLIFLRKI